MSAILNRKDEAEQFAFLYTQFAKGVTIQRNRGSSHNPAWRDIEHLHDISAGLPADDYRVQPYAFTTPPPDSYGWHNPFKLSAEEVDTNNYRLLLVGETVPEGLEEWNAACQRWEKLGTRKYDWSCTARVEKDKFCKDYRKKNELVKLCPTDLPGRTIFRRKSWAEGEYVCPSVYKEGIVYLTFSGYAESRTWELLKIDWQYRDKTGVWQDCSKKSL